jgi:hypothetical protein
MVLRARKRKLEDNCAKIYTTLLPYSGEIIMDGSEEGEFDFKTYVDIVTKAGDRSRSVIYVCLIVTFCIAATILNTYVPAWNNARFIKIQTALVCWEQKTVSAHCADAIEYAGFRGFKLLTGNGDFVSKDSEVVRELKKRVDDLSEKDLNQNSFTVPFFNASIDVNDLWVLTGGVVTFLYFLIASCLAQEVEALALAAKYAINPYKAELLLSTGVLGRHSALLRGGIVLFLPLLVTAYALLDFWGTYKIGYDLVGKPLTLVILAVLNCLSVIQFYFYLKICFSLKHIGYIYNKLTSKIRSRKNSTGF